MATKYSQQILLRVHSDIKDFISEQAKFNDITAQEYIRILLYKEKEKVERRQNNNSPFKKL